jgi:hypothetical protein
MDQVHIGIEDELHRYFNTKRAEISKISMKDMHIEFYYKNFNSVLASNIEILSFILITYFNYIKL